MSNKAFYGIAIALVISAAALGYLLLVPKADQTPVAPATPAPVVPQTPAAPATPAPTTTAVGGIAPEILDPIMVKAALTFPAIGAPQAEYKTQFDAVSKMAKSATEMQIGQSCVTNPRFISEKEDSMLILRNVDTVSHKIFFSPGHEFLVEAGKTNTIKLDFVKAPGLAGYNCDPSKDHGITGVMVVIK